MRALPFPRSALLRPALFFLYAAAALAAGLTSGTAAPRLAEFLADNRDTIRDEDGEASGWLEIHNPDPDPVNLSGYRLTASPAGPDPWIFPDVILQPGERRVIWTSGKNRTLPKRPLHTNFTLSPSGGYLALLPARGDTPLTVYQDYPPQFPDRSYGIYQPEKSLPLIGPSAPCRWIVPAGPLPGWQNPGFPDAAWFPARTGIGFDLADSGITYHPLLGAGGDTLSAQYEKNATAWLRIPFQVSDRRDLSALTLRMKYDDGFILWLNGARLVSRFAPDSPDWNSAATALHDDTDALEFEEIPLPAGLGSLRDGENILAIQTLNGSPDNQDALMVPELDLRLLNSAVPESRGYFLTPTPGTANPVAEAGFTADTKFSTDRGFFDAPFALRISCATPGATIYYTTDGSQPVPRTARVYTSPLTILGTTVVRAMADADARHPSNTDTQTYLFPADIIRQTRPSGYPATWGSDDNGFGSLFPVPADYAMDQTVVTGPAYAGLTEKGLRDSLPVISLTTGRDLLFEPDGIYANGRYGSREIPVSMELFGPGWPETRQLDAGIRIHGGNARDHPKKPFRLYFRKNYGPGKLNYPLFPDSPVDRFDQLILRPGGHDGWAVPFGNSTTLLAFHATYVRDQFLRLTESAMGRLSPRGRYVHLYLNGLYWGIYDLHERANADFYSSHLGGEPADWDVLHHPAYVGENYSQVDGDGIAWDRVQDLADTGIQQDADYDSLAALLDIDGYIDHLIVRIWSGDYDWCSPVYLKNGDTEASAGYFDNKNWYCARRSRGGESGRFLFHVWDAEMSMGAHLMVNLGSGGQPPWLSYQPPQRIAGFDSTRVGTPGSVAWPYAVLRSYPLFRQQFGDRLQRHFFGNGRMTTAANTARLDSLTAQLELPLVAESARWGDVNRLDPSNLTLTRDIHWKPEIEWLRDTFMAGRNTTVLGQFKAIGLFPSTPAPVTVPDSAAPSAGSDLRFAPSPTASQIFYTLDGSDPVRFTPIRQQLLLDEGDPSTWWVPTSSIGTSWRTAGGPSNPGVWQPGRNGFGYDTDTTYLPWILTDVETLMRGRRPGIYIRMEFILSSQEEIDSLATLLLEARYDDGFIAAINGTVVQRANAPASETFSSTATVSHSDTEAVRLAAFALDPAQIRPLLRPGVNLLAIQGLNLSTGSSDFLCSVRLSAGFGGSPLPSSPARSYDPADPPVVDGGVTVKARTLGPDGWSPLTEVPFLTDRPASRGLPVLSKIQYHPAPPDEAETAAGFTDDGDFEFIELLNPCSDSVDLSGCHFTSGLAFDFDASPLRLMVPGARILIARNPEALIFRHGPGLPLAGAFAGSTALSNSGERLRLAAADGSTVFDVYYQDQLPWPDAPDGTGPALVLINPLGLNDPSSPLHWRTGLNPSGAPGRLDAPGYQSWASSSTLTLLPVDDPDGDGFANLLEYATGSLPRDARSTPFFHILSSADTVRILFPVNPAAEDAALVLEESTSPAGPWRNATDLREIASPADPGIRQYEIRPGPAQPRRFYRLRASLLIPP